MFDIFFISYNEVNADANWANLKDRFSIARRIHGVKGIHQAHKAAAAKAYTKMFWVVDGDSEVLDSFTFYDPEGLWKPEESVYVYKSQNPINGLSYGYGGIKLLPTTATLAVDESTVDMTTSIGNYFTAVDEIASVTNFNTDPFNTWRSAFRECVKLSSNIIDGQVDDETAYRLNVWCTRGLDAQYGRQSIEGAVAGKDYGIKNKDNVQALAKINDFDWLQKKFNKEIV